MTDNEIIKALECCANHDNVDACDDCPCLKGECISTTPYVLDLINRQKAEIERLKSPAVMQIEVSEKIEKSIKAEAVKEFAERLKEKLNLNDMVMGSNCAFVEDFQIDNLVKEMVGAESG
jgi:hypothetical protein